MTVESHASARVRHGAAPQTPPAYVAPGGQRPLFTIMGRDGLRVIDQATIIAWFVVITFPVPLRSLVLYACCGYFVASLFLHAKTFMPILLRCWPFFIIGTLALISCLWAPSPAEAIRKSLLLYMTAIVAIFFAGRLTARQILYTLFGVLFFAGIASALRPDYVGSAATGIFDQKNMLALNMFFLYGPSLILLFDRKAPQILRLMAVVAAPMAAYLIIIAESATNLMVMLLATAGLVAHQMIWLPASRMRHLRTLVIGVVALLILVGSFIVFGLIQADFMTLLLESLGKDSTLTGRTVLWETAKRVMEERPWTGMGAVGFWRPEVGSANTLLTFMHFETFSPLNFHSSYYENGVAYGYPGFYGTMFVAAFCLFQSFRNWLKLQTMFNMFFLLLAVSSVLRCFSETDLAIEFGAVMLYLSAARFGVPQPEALEQSNRRAPSPPIVARVNRERRGPRRESQGRP